MPVRKYKPTTPGRRGSSVSSFDELTRRTLVVLAEPHRETELSFRNLPHVKVTYSRSLSVYDLVAADHVLFTTAALDVLEGKEPTQADDTGSEDEE